MNIIILLLVGALSGLIGAFAMTAFMLQVSAFFSERVDMVQALGSYFTGKVKGSSRKAMDHHHHHGSNQGK